MRVILHEAMLDAASAAEETTEAVKEQPPARGKQGKVGDPVAKSPKRRNDKTVEEGGEPKDHALATRSLLEGKDSPMQSRTPDGPHSHFQHQHLSEVDGGKNKLGNGSDFMCVDQWDWRTDAPEFVPGGGGMNDMNGGGVYADNDAWNAQMAAQTQPGACKSALEKLNGQGVGVNKEARLHQLRNQLDWQLQSKGEEVQKMQNSVNQLEVEIAQVQTSWEMERRQLMRQLSHYRAVLDRYCIPVEEAGPASISAGGGYDASAEVNAAYGYDQAAAQAWDAACENGALATGQANLGFGAGAMMMGSYGEQVEVPMGGGCPSTSTLDSKMQRLNNLLSGSRILSGGKEGSADGTDGGAGEEAGEAGGSIASTLRQMFPHATIRTTGHGVDGSEEGDEREEEAVSADQILRGLETQVGRPVDDRALRSLHLLTVRERLEALGKVSELVQSQGGHCRNLSSILQSVCRKIEKRCNRGVRSEEKRLFARQELPTGSTTTASTAAARDLPAKSPSGPAGGSGTAGRATTRRSDQDPDAFGSSGSEDFADKYGATSKRSGTPNSRRSGLSLARQESAGSESGKPNTPAGRRSNRSWADMHSGDEDEGKEDTFESMMLSAAAAKVLGATTGSENSDDKADDDDKEDEGTSGEDYWTSRRVEKVAKMGFDLRCRGDHWDLKIAMGNLEPAFTKTGMERYCEWLRDRLGAFREEHGPEPLRHCRGEVDFSHDKMTNEMVWMLLETLAQNEVHVALLKLFANQISQGGVLAICEFIRTNLQADAMQELHLSHNEVDDESALELLRTFNQRPRYPPHRSPESSVDLAVAPVWLRLNHNRVVDPEAVRRAAESEGITICSATDRHVCGTTRCGHPRPDGECPIVHLYTFKVQS